MPGQVAYLGSRASEDEARKWVIRCAAAGLGIVFLIIAIHQLYQVSVGPATPPEEVAEAPEDAGPPPEPEVAVVATPVRPPPPRPAPRPAVKAPVAAKPREPTPPPGPSPWVEPSDPVVAEPPEASFGAVDEGRFVPDWARGEVPAAMPGNLVRVRRVVDPRDPSQKSTLRLAFDVLGGTVEVDDRGPFFEDDLRIFGESRLIRAGAARARSSASSRRSSRSCRGSPPSSSSKARRWSSTGSTSSSTRGPCRASRRRCSSAEVRRCRSATARSR